MTIELSLEDRIKVLNGNDLFMVMQRILIREEKIDQDREHFWIVGLANNQRILFIELVSLGSVNSTIAKPMDVFGLALQKRAVRVVLVHNHPSGELSPSDQDKELTDQMIQVGIIVDTPVYDHLIITTNSYYSFRDSGLLEVLERSTKYVPKFELQRREIAEIREKEAILAISNMVIKAVEKGLDVQLISELTGLSIEEIELIKSGN